MKGFRQDRQGNGGEAKEGRRGRESRTTCLWGTQVADLRSRKNRGKTALLTVHSWVRNRKVGRSRKSAYLVLTKRKERGVCWRALPKARIEVVKTFAPPWIIFYP